MELAIGGLVFSPSPDMAMEAQELTITPEFVNVKYRLANRGTNPVTLTLSFPLPDIDLADADANYAFPANDPVNFVAFQTKIDGKPVKFDVRQRAMIGDKDVTDAVTRAGMALLPIGAQSTAVGGLDAQAREKLINDGVLMASGTDVNGQPIYRGNWLVKTAATRKQVFPPAKPVMVEHRYQTSLGISLDTVLRKPVRQAKGMEAEFERYRTTYCVPEDLLKGVDRLAGPTDANVAKMQERRMAYALKTNLSWAAPIQDFRLVIDKGKPDRLVSFCGENVKKISPTAFEIRANDYTPAQDLKILLISKGETTEARKLPRVDKPVPPSINPVPTASDRPSP